MLFVVAFVALVSGALAETESPSEYRLPGDVIPRHYQIEIIINFVDKVQLGALWIKMECIRSTSTVKLHSRGLNIIGEVIIYEENKHVNEQKGSIAWDEHKDFLLVSVTEELKQGVNYILHFRYNGDLNRKPEGFFITEYRAPSSPIPKYYASTKVRAMARTFFPCFDEPAMRATFALKVAYQEGFCAFSNMSVKSKSWSANKPGMLDVLLSKSYNPRTCMNEEEMGTRISEEWKVPSNLVCEEFQETPPMSPHQLVLLVGDFETIRLTDSTPIQLVFLRHRTVEADVNKSPIRIVMEHFRNYFKMPFPLAKLDFIVLPYSTFGAYYGTVVVPDAIIRSEKLQLRDIQNLTHDIASQWIGGLVSIKWWSDIWYTYALADHLTILAIEKVLPGRSYFTDVIIYNRHKLVNFLGNHEDPVYKVLKRPTGLVIQWKSHSYWNKGPLLMRMVCLSFGNDLFQEGVTAFINEFRDRAADHNDLWNSLTNVAHKANVISQTTLKELMEGWVTQPGYPVVTVRREGEATNTLKIFVSQVQSTKCAMVPISFFSNTSPDTKQPSSEAKIWLDCKHEETLTKENEEPWSWVIVNVGLAGLYKVKYDTGSWELFSQALCHPDHSNIDVLSRTQLIDDALDLARNGVLEYKSAFKLALYLEHEMSSLPWKIALQKFGFIKDNFLRNIEYPTFQRLLRRLLTPIFRQNKDENFPVKLDKVPRTILKWSCDCGVDACKDFAGKLFNDFKRWKDLKDGTTNPLARRVRRVVYCDVVRRGATIEWEILKDYFDQINEESDRKHVLYGLSCTTNTTRLEEYLHWSMDENAALPDYVHKTVFKKVAANPYGYHVAWDFMFNNYAGNTEIPDTLLNHVRVLVNLAVSQDELNKLGKFMGQCRLPFSESSKLFNTEFRSAKTRFSWMKKYQEPVVSAINEIIKNNQDT